MAFLLLAVVVNVSVFLIFLIPSLYLPFSHYYHSDGCLDVPVLELMSGLQRLLAMGAFYCLGAD